jgi:hypothetical protein
LGLVLLAVLVVPRTAHTEPPAAETVKLIVDYGDGVEKHFTRLKWRSGITVLDTLNDARQHARGITFKSRGSGATAFVYAIDEQENEANGRAWLYKVNGQLADRSCGIFELQPADTVLWTFDKYR